MALLVKEIRFCPTGALLLSLALALAACGGDDSSSNGTNGTNGANGTNGTNGTVPEDDVPDRVSYVDTLTIPPLGGDDRPTCCIDFGERSKNAGIDNAFAELADQLGGLAEVSLQDTVDEGLQDGSQVILFNHVGLVDENDGFRMEGLLGEFEGTTTYAEASAGTGTFTVNPSSYQNGNAVIQLGGNMSAGAMTAGPDNFALSLPLGDVIVAINISETLLTGDASLNSETTVSYADGELSGYLLVDEIFEGLNAYLDAECTCLGVDGDVFQFDEQAEEWSANCADNADACENSGCENIGSGIGCALLPTALQGFADIDTNNDPGSPVGSGRWEGLSVGLGFTAQNATIVE